jgi:hypothetical protein
LCGVYEPAARLLRPKPRENANVLCACFNLRALRGVRPGANDQRSQRTERHVVRFCFANNRRAFDEIRATQKGGRRTTPKILTRAPDAFPDEKK